MARDFLYHVWDHDDFNGKPALSAIELSVPVNKAVVRPDEREAKRFYSLKRDLEELRKEGVTKGIVDATVVSLPTRSIENRELWAIKIGNGSQHKVLINGCHHSREWIALEHCYYLAEYLVHTFKDKAQTEEEKRVKHLVTNREIWIVPLVNPDGHMHTISENRFWRPNRRKLEFADDTDIVVAKPPRTIKVKKGTYRGVDVNRNYATANWGEETFHPESTVPATSRDPKDGGNDAVFCGMSAGSEPETKAISDLIDAQKFKALLSYHSFGQDYIFPNQVDGNDFLTELKDGMSQLVSQYGNPYNFRSSSNYRYRTTGDAIDFYVEKMPLRPAYTPEVRPRNEPEPPESGKFSGLAESEIEPCFKENLAAALALIAAAPFTAPPADVKIKADEQHPLVQVVRGAWRPYQGWNPTL